jgi:thioredoxin
MIDVTMANFEQEVIAASMNVPVLVDFWAPWCGPCKSLGPVLEKLELDYGGRFKLVKINSDDEQQLAGAFGIRSIPTCVLLVGGRPVDGFAGALPEGKVREFLDKHLPSDEELQAQAGLIGNERYHTPVILVWLAPDLAAVDQVDERLDRCRWVCVGPQMISAKAGDIDDRNCHGANAIDLDRLIDYAT